MELIVDGHCSNTHLMTDREAMAAWLKAMAHVIDMTPFGEPVIQGFPWPESDDWDALSAVQFLKESAIVVHTYPERQAAFFNIFSCRDFDKDKALAFLKTTFRLNLLTASVLVLERGVDGETGAIQKATLRGADR